MPEAVFLVGMDADRSSMIRALTTEDGIKSWWTTRASVPPRVGEVFTVGFPEAPVPFELRIDEVGEDRVKWTSVGEFPPHWVGTEVVWNVNEDPEGPGISLFFEHRGFVHADPALGFTAFTWSNLMHSLKRYLETGEPRPFFP